MAEKWEVLFQNSIERKKIGFTLKSWFIASNLERKNNDRGDDGDGTRKKKTLSSNKRKIDDAVNEKFI